MKWGKVYLKVPRCTSKYPNQKYLKVSRSAQKYLEVPQSTQKFPEVSISIKKYLEVPRITSLILISIKQLRAVWNTQSWMDGWDCLSLNSEQAAYKIAAKRC